MPSSLRFFIPGGQKPQSTPPDLPLPQGVDTRTPRARGCLGATPSANHPAQYVKLDEEGQGDGKGKDKDIVPGELNQPVSVPQLEARETRRCDECRQLLPPNYTPPREEPWTTGIFGCAEDPESCRTGLLCPCVLFGRNAEAITGGRIPWMSACISHAVCVEGGIALGILTAVFHGVIAPHWISYLIGEGVVTGCVSSACTCFVTREFLQKKYHLKDSPCNPLLVHCCLHCCANCQEHREMKARLPVETVAPVTVVNPPPVQEMSMAEIRPSVAPENEAPIEG